MTLERHLDIGCTSDCRRNGCVLDELPICGVCLKPAIPNENCPYFEDEDNPNQPHLINPEL